MNCSVEGFQGSGKSTLINKLSERHPDCLPVCEESKKAAFVGMDRKHPIKLITLQSRIGAVVRFRDDYEAAKGCNHIKIHQF